MKKSNLINKDKILVIRLSSMGDVALTTHTVRCIRNTYPNAKIDFITLKSYLEIYEYSPYIDNLFLYEKEFSDIQLLNFKKNILEQNKGKYSIIIDLQNNFRSKKLSQGLSDRIEKFKKRRLHKLFLIFLKKGLDKRGLTIPELYLETANCIDVVDDGKALEIWTSDDKDSGKYLPYFRNSEVKNNLTIGIAPGAHFFTKRYPLSKFVELINLMKIKFNCNFVLIGGKDDFELCEKIRNSNPEIITNKSGSESIMQTISNIDTFDVLITNDTGVMHLASARQIPIIAIFGSSVKEFGFVPFRVKNIIIEENIGCRPCSHIGKNACPKKHFDCMEKLEPKEITKILLEEIIAKK